MPDDVFEKADDQSGEKQLSILEQLVGEGKKFASPEDLAKGKLQADEHIKTIEQENAELRSKLEKAGAPKIEELMEAIKAQTNKDSDGAQTMSQEELTKVIESVISERTTAETKAANRQKGNELVLKLAGGDVERARDLVAERAKQVGMSAKALAALSEESPTAFARLMQDDTKGSSGSTTQLPHQQTPMEGEQAQMEVNGVKTKAWFDAKRKELGVRKYVTDKTVQRELSRSMAAGIRFNT